MFSYSVVMITFQIIFYTEMHDNDIFLFFKNYFKYQYIKTTQNIQNILNFNKTKTFENTIFQMVKP
jgi:hypothetical protein